MADWYGKPVRYWRETAHKSGRPEINTTLDDCMWREQQHHQGDVGDPGGLFWEKEENFSGAWEKSATVTLPSLTVKGILCICTNILPTPRFCPRQNFVNAEILSKPKFSSAPMFCVSIYFCLRRCFVGAYIFVGADVLTAHIFLSAPMFWRCVYFCQWRCFAGTYVLWTSSSSNSANYFVDAKFFQFRQLCRRQYFVAANIFFCI